MSELIKGLVNVRDPLTLLAFLSLVGLAAFKTRKVPELFFGLLREKLTREKFSQIVNRFMLFGLIGFVLLCGIAGLGYVLAYKIQAAPVGIEAFRAEIQGSQRPVENGQQAVERAVKAYEDGTAYVEKSEFESAIQSFEESLKQIPTLSAQYTLALLYYRLGNDDAAKKYARQAVAAAKTLGSSIDTVKSEELLKNIDTQDTLVGTKAELPRGGDSPESAVPISEGRYISDKSFRPFVSNFFKQTLRAGQTLVIKYRTPDYSGVTDFTVLIQDKNGGTLKETRDYRENKVLEAHWTAAETGPYYINIKAGSPGTVYLITVR